MSAHREGELERLRAAHGNRELGGTERRRLETLAAEDPRLARELGDVEALHRSFDRERGLRRQAMAPLEPREAGDEVYRRLARRAARAERALRDLAADRTPAVVVPRARRLSLPRLLLLSAAAALLWVALRSGALAPAPPTDHRLRAGPGIVLRPEISAASREISWHAVAGARTYDATISDAAGGAVLARPEDASRSLVWQLAPEQYAGLQRHPGPLFLRIVARDGAGILLDTSGDLPLTIR